MAEQINLIGSKAYQIQTNKMHLLLNDWMDEQNDTNKVFETPYPESGLRLHETLMSKSSQKKMYNVLRVPHDK